MQTYSLADVAAQSQHHSLCRRAVDADIAGHLLLCPALFEELPDNFDDVPSPGRPLGRPSGETIPSFNKYTIPEMGRLLI